MKTISLYLFFPLFVLLSIGCGESGTKAKSKLELNPTHKKVEFYIKLSAPYIPQVGALSPRLANKSLEHKNKWELKLNPIKDKSVEYEFNITYVGNSESADSYEAEVIYNSSKGPVRKKYTISYTGETQLIHAVSEEIACEVGIRPVDKK